VMVIVGVGDGDGEEKRRDGEVQPTLS
jgi:hypothetical protein